MRKRPKDDPAVDKTNSVIRLIKYFMEEIRLRGEDGLPVWREELDPLVTDDEYGKEVLTAYKNKPPNYEQILAVKFHDGSYQRQIKVKKKSPQAKCQRGCPRKQQVEVDSFSLAEESTAASPVHKIPCNVM